MPALVLQCAATGQLPLPIGSIGCGCVPRRTTACFCGAPSRYVEHVRWSGPTRGISFFYYCAACWRKPGPYGLSPEDRERERRDA
jgi:hypothetical protein